MLKLVVFGCLIIYAVQSGKLLIYTYIDLYNYTCKRESWVLYWTIRSILDITQTSTMTLILTTRHRKANKLDPNPLT